MHIKFYFNRFNEASQFLSSLRLTKGKRKMLSCMFHFIFSCSTKYIEEAKVN